MCVGYFNEYIANPKLVCNNMRLLLFFLLLLVSGTAAQTMWGCVQAMSDSPAANAFSSCQSTNVQSVSFYCGSCRSALQEYETAVTEACNGVAETESITNAMDEAVATFESTCAEVASSSKSNKSPVSQLLIIALLTVVGVLV